MRIRYSFMLGAAFTAPALAANINVTIEIPQLNVAEYHKPYVALWIENADQAFVRNLAVWYDIRKKDNGGTKWLKDVRQWWRKSGRDLQMPVDGVSGATKTPGVHEASFNGAKYELNDLPAGKYTLVAEAAREAGGREVVRVPFQWPPTGTQTVQAKGDHELGAVSVELKP
jgi:hypothetical protein